MAATHTLLQTVRLAGRAEGRTRLPGSHLRQLRLPPRCLHPDPCRCSTQQQALVLAKHLVRDYRAGR
jgi:hypothetical protein